MDKPRALKLNNNKSLIGCSNGWQTDREGYKGVWCTNNKGKKYFWRKGESQEDAILRFESQYDKDTDVVTKKAYSKDLDSAVMAIYSSVRNTVNEIGYSFKYVFAKGKCYLVRINKNDDDFDYDVIGVREDD